MKQRKRSASVMANDQDLLPVIREIKADHPSWGYRRVHSYLPYRKAIVIGKNRVYRILKENNLLALSCRKLKACRTFGRSKPRTNQPNTIWGIDMTKVAVDSWGWLYLHVLKDWGSKKIVGWTLSPQSKTTDWLEALQSALNAEFPDGIREADSKLKLISDNGCQPTSANFMAACSVLHIEQIFTSYNNPKGNADTERVFRTMKEDLIWLHDWTSYQQLQNALNQWINDYNHDFIHSSLGAKITPAQYHHNNLIKHNKTSFISL